MTPLTAWVNFYIIVGSSAGALTGLTFVVITLLPQARPRGAEGGIAAFTTPTIVHFGAVLFVCALLSAPWPALTPAALLLGVAGLAGVLYTVVVMRRQRRLDKDSFEYTPVLEDWLRYVVCPFVAYLALLAGAMLLLGSPGPALFVIGGAMLLLLFLAISNAWDIVTYIAIARIPAASERDEQKEP
jgi:hypothetical protein